MHGGEPKDHEIFARNDSLRFFTILVDSPALALRGFGITKGRSVLRLLPAQRPRVNTCHLLTTFLCGTTAPNSPNFVVEK